jgi:hypothetical protein
MPPGGPNVEDFNPVSMWGVDAECFRALLCKIGGIAGELGTSRVVFRITKSDVFVLRLSWLGRFFMGGIMGLMKVVDGDAGSEIRFEAMAGGWIERPFMFRARLGDGDVMGLSVLLKSMAAREDIADGRGPKLGPGKDESGIKLMGESGDEDGEGSERGEESAVDRVVVGDESADSEACVEVLSWCLW